MEEKFTPKDFIKDIERISNLKDNRVFIWYCNLYIEHYVKLIFKKYKNGFKFRNCNECKRSLEPSFLQKIKELSDANIINRDYSHEKLIKEIYIARNSAGHELNFSEDKIINDIKEQLSKVKTYDPYGIIKKLFDNITPWKNLEIAAVSVIFDLYQKFEKMNGRKVSEKMIFEINPECTIIIPVIITKEDKRF